MPPAIVKTFFDSARTKTATHVVTCPETKETVVFDAVLHYRPEDGHINPRLSDDLISYVRDSGLKVSWIIDTHVHADHLSAMALLEDAFPGARTGIGARIATVQELFGGIFNFEDGFKRDGSQFGHLFADGETMKVGTLTFTAMYTPGHTPVCTCYYFEDDLVVTGDTIFMPDSGTARCDFPGGSVTDLWQSVQRILALPPQVRVFVGHDYGAGGKRDFSWETTIAEELESNIHVKKGTSEAEFTKFRTERDKVLGTPQLLIPSVQVNARAGRLPPAASNGTVYLLVPVNKIGPDAGDIPKPLFDVHG